MRVLTTLSIVLLLTVACSPALAGAGATPTTGIFLPVALRPENTPTPTLTPTATVPPTATHTPTATPTSPPQNTGMMTIVSIFADGSGPDEPDEYAVIRNDDTHSIQLNGWSLSDDANHVFTFPAFVITPGQTCRVYTNQNHPEWCGFNYGSASAIWNNGGDCATLRNGVNGVVDNYCY